MIGWFIFESAFFYLKHLEACNGYRKHCIFVVSSLLIGGRLVLTGSAINL